MSTNHNASSGESHEEQTRRIIDKIFKDPKAKYELTEFEDLDKPAHKILTIYPKIVTSGRDAGKTKYFLKSLARFESGRDEVQVFVDGGKSAPEEIVRQLWIYRLLNSYGYRNDQILLEKRVYFGSEVFDKPCDIIVYRDSSCTTPKIIFEIKRPKRKDGIEQLKSYLNAEGSPVGVWSNGSDRIILYRPYPRDFDDTLSDIPSQEQEPKDVLEEARTLADLRLEFNFKKIIQDLEELVLADSGADEFNEIFKLIFAKIWDEKEAEENRSNKEVKFRKSADPETTYDRINSLFRSACNEWKGVFKDGEDIDLRKDHLQVCIGPIEGVRLMGSNLRVMDDAFEYLLPTEAKKKKGQFFTPRYVVDACVRMLNPKRNEYVIDPACGSSGFLVHTMDWCYPAEDAVERELRKSRYASKYLWGIDFEARAAKTSRALMLVAGDGHTKIFGPDVSSLDPHSWFGTTTGRHLMSELRRASLTESSIPSSDTLTDDDKAWDYFGSLKFDVVLTNPPFSGEIKDKKLLSRYELAIPALRRAKNKSAKEERDVLFIERILGMLRPGGRAAIVLPQGKFNNSSFAYIRTWLFQKARVLAVVGLHGNTFKPHTGTKTSLLLLQKYTQAEIAEIESERQRIAASCPDYEAEIRDLINSCSDDSDVSEEDVRDEVLQIISDEFDDIQKVLAELTSTADESDEESYLNEQLDLDTVISELTDQIVEYEEQLEKIDQSNTELDERLSSMEANRQCELDECTAGFDREITDKQAEIGRKTGPEISAIRKEKTTRLREVRAKYAEAKKDLRKETGVGRKRLKAERKTIEKSKFEAERNLLLLTVRGRLELLVRDGPAIGELKKRYIETTVSKELDYQIFMAVSERGGKNNSGEYEFAKDDEGNLLADADGHPIVDQDLVNYSLSIDDLEDAASLSDQELCIAEAFIKFAQTNALDFWGATN